MNLEQFIYNYPEELIAIEKSSPVRVMYVDSSKKPMELTKQKLLSQFQPGDVLVINDTKVEKRRVHTETGLEVLFIEKLNDEKWHVLFPSSRIKNDQIVNLPGGLSFKLLARGLPQTIKLSGPLPSDYFANYGQMALPPYIQKKRKERTNNSMDEVSYQTDWADIEGSCAAPTASLHFSEQDILGLKNTGVHICKLTLHVGLGTFLPIKTKDIIDHQMHKEWVQIPKKTLDHLSIAKKNNQQIWALGTTVTRSIESIGKGFYTKKDNGSLIGETDLFLYPGKEFNYVTRLLTNFHQPGSTLMALVAAFAGLDEVKKCYAWAIEKKFKLFSYGDLSVWEKSN